MRTLPGYIASKIVQAAAVLLAAFALTFAILYLLPSDPVAIATNADPGTVVDPAAVELMRERYGLDQPPWVQFWNSLTGALTGDFGRSIATGQPVTEAIAAAFPGTLQLAALAIVLAAAVGIGVAVLATYSQSPWLRNLFGALPPLGVAVPTFWVGLLLLQFFSFRFPIFPAFGDAGFASVVLPAITLAIPQGALLAQVLTASLTSAWQLPFVDVVAAKGASRWYILRHHVFRVASLPAFTIGAVIFGNLLAGAVVEETVFSRPGIGLLAQRSVMAQDIPVVQALVLLSATIFVVVNLVIDLIYPLVDPRIVKRTKVVAHA